MKRFLAGILIIIIFLCALIIVFVTSNTGLRTAFNIIAWSSSGELSATEINGSLASGKIYLENLRYHDKNNRLTIANLRFNWKPAQLFSGRLFVSKIEINKVRIQHNSSDKKKKEESPPNKPFSLPIAITVENASINDIRYRSDDSKPQKIQAIHFALNSKKNIFYIKKLSLKAKPNTLSLQGHVNLTSPYQTDIKGTFENQGKVYKKLAGSYAIKGDIAHQLNAVILASKPVELNLHAKITQAFHNGLIDVHGSWHQIAFALSKKAYIHSDDGKINVSGHLNHYQATLSTDISSNKFPKTYATLNGIGSLQHFKIKKLSVRINKSLLLASGQIQWKPKLQWQLEVKGKQFNPETFWPEINANLHFTLNSKGQYHEGTLITQETLTKLSGLYNQKKIMGHASISTRNHDINIHDFLLKLANNSISINGHIGKINTLQWKVSIKHLHEFYPAYAGSIDSIGSLSGSLKQPLLKARINANRLSTPIVRLKSFHMQGVLNTNIHQPSNFTIKAEKLFYNDFKITQLYFSGKGSAAKHQTYLHLIARKENLFLSSHGYYKNSTLHETIKKLTLTSREFNDWALSKPFQVIFNKRMLHITPFCWQSDNQHFICGKSNYDSKKDWHTQIIVKHLNLGILNVFLPNSWHINTDINSKLNLRGDNKHAPTGKLDILFNLLKIRKKQDNTTIQLSLKNSRFAVQADKTGLHSQALIHLYSTNNPLNLSLSLPDYRLFDKIKRKQKIAGKLSIDWRSLNQFAKLSPYIDTITGRLLGQITLDGSVRKPKLNGSIKLSNGTISTKEYGLKLRNIQLKLNANEQKINLLASLRSGSGTLSLNASSKISQPLSSFNATIKGSNVLIANTKEFTITISPDLQIAFPQAGLLAVTGKINIPMAKIAPKDFSSVVTLPDNFVVISRRNQQQNKQMQLSLKVAVSLGKKISFKYAGLEASLGGEMTISSQPKTVTTGIGRIYVIKGRYKAYGKKLDIQRGLILFTGGDISDPGLNILATKSIPIYNLGAVAQASGEQSVVVGVRITGTVSNPKITLYSQPPMSQTDILSYLLFNKPSDAAGGGNAAILTQAAGFLTSGHTSDFTQNIEKKLGLSTLGVESSQIFVPGETGPKSTTSFVVGKQITKRLSALYTVGLSLPISILMLRYQLAKHWQIQTQTSNYDNGADIVYTIESG